MLIERDIIRFSGDKSDEHRVVWADQHNVWLFDLAKPKTSLRRHNRHDLEARMVAGEAVIITDHSHNAFYVESALSEVQRVRRDSLLNIIAPLVAKAPDIFDHRVRGRAVAEIERNGVRSTKTVHAALDRWWRRGMSADALVQQFNNGRRPRRKEGAKRSGRKQQAGTPQGLIITPELEKIFRNAIRRFYANDRKNALSSVYRMMIGEWFVDEIRDPYTGDVTYRSKVEYAETGFPTLRQFRFWYSKQEDLLGTRRKREGAINYDKDRRSTTGSASEHLVGVGSRMEIDATQLEHGAISEINAGVPLDPPNYYQVVDVVSGLICGIYVGFEEASWIGASMAVRNVTEDKVEFAKRFGVSIEPHHWPCQGVLPKRLMADNAEFKGDLATSFTAKSRVIMENARALRGDDKGTVEGKFNQFKTELRHRLPGLRKRNQATPYAPDHSADACLTLRQITAAVIETVILLNNRLMDKHPTRAMMEAGVNAVPSEMWAWAVRTATSELRRCDPAEAEFTMLPTETASITADGVRFRGLYYRGADPRAHIFERARQDGVTRVTISFDPLNTNTIYLHDANDVRGYQVFGLTGSSKHFRDISFADAAAMQAQIRRQHSNLQHQQAEVEARFARSQAAAERRGRAARQTKFRPSEIKKGGQNKKTERALERSERSTALPRATPSAPVVVDAAEQFAPAGKERQADIMGDDAFDAWVSNKDKS